MNESTRIQRNGTIAALATELQTRICRPIAVSVSGRRRKYKICDQTRDRVFFYGAYHSAKAFLEGYALGWDAGIFHGPPSRGIAALPRAIAKLKSGNGGQSPQ